MADELELVVAESAPNGAIAHLLAQALQEAGIPAYVGGTLLQDEWAASQRLMGLLSVEVQVPRARLAEAREVIASLRVGAAELDEEDAEEDSPDGAEAAGALPSQSSAELWTEVLLVAAVTIIPYTVWACMELAWPEGKRWKAAEFFAAALGGSIPPVAVVFYLISRSREPWARFGIRRVRWVTDLALALGIFAMGAVWIWPITFRISESLGLEVRSGLEFDSPHAALSIVWIVPGLLTEVIAEEMVMRAYLIPRLARLTGSVLLAILCSAALFAVYHVYQGPGALVSVFGAGILYGGAFCLTRSVWPTTLAHFFWNVWAVLG